jgi:hypothetical protein
VRSGWSVEGRTSTASWRSGSNASPGWPSRSKPFADGALAVDRQGAADAVGDFQPVADQRVGLLRDQPVDVPGRALAVVVQVGPRALEPIVQARDLGLELRGLGRVFLLLTHG